MAAAEPTYDALKKVIKEIRTKITKHANENVSEASTKIAFINPMLSALGWNVEDLDEIILEYCPKPGYNPADYGLMADGQAVAVFEAKRLQVNVDDAKHVAQTVSYAAVCGVTWCVLTNGDEYRIYKLDLPGDAEEKLFRAVKLSDGDPSDDIIPTLSLLSKDSLANGEIDRVWRENHVDARVRETVEQLFADGDMRLVKIIRKELDDLKPAEIRDALKRATVEVTLGPPVPPIPKPTPKPEKMSTTAGQITMTLKGEEFTCKYANQVLITTADWLVKQGKLSASDCPVVLTGSRGQGSKRCAINTEPIHPAGHSFHQPHQISGGLYVETHVSRANAEKYSRQLLKWAGLDPEILVADWEKQAATGPITMTLNGEEFTCKYCYEVFMTTTDWLVKQGKLSKADCPVELTRGGKQTNRRVQVNSEPMHPGGRAFRRPFPVSGGVYVEANISKADSEELSRRLLAWCGMKREDLEIDWGK